MNVPQDGIRICPDGVRWFWVVRPYGGVAHNGHSRTRRGAERAAFRFLRRYSRKRSPERLS